MMDIAYITSHAEEILYNILWEDGPVCPYCKSHHYSKTKDGRYYCKHCHHKYNIKTNTIFYHSKVSLDKWMIALYLLLTNNGISSVSLGKYIMVSQTTAYYMMMKLRFLFCQDDTVLHNEIAIDEAYIGGQWSKFSLSKRNILLKKYKLLKRPKTASERSAIANRINALYKTPIIGMNDGQSIILKVLHKPVSQEEIVDIFYKHTNKEEVGHTVADYSKLYDNWKLLTGWNISQNNHSKSQYKTEDGRSSNRIEGTFSQLKRQTLNKHCSISSRLLQLYLDEFTYRYNNRDIAVEEQMKRLIKKCDIRVQTCDIRRYKSLDDKYTNKEEIFDPVEFFTNGEGQLLDAVKIGDIVYRREEWT